jgi:hypothetical protein
MRNAILVPIILFGSFIQLAAQKIEIVKPPADYKPDYALLVNGKIFHNKDVITKDDLKNVCALMVILPSGERIRPENFQWVMQMNGGIWKFDRISSCDASMPPKTYATFNKQLAEFTPTDMLFIDEFKFPGKTSDFPSGFQFSVK